MGPSVGGSALPPAREFLSGAPVAIANAWRHLRGADALAAVGEWGLADAHVTLAVEEGVKAATLSACGLGANFPQRWLNKMLRNHRARHQLGEVAQIFFTIFERLHGLGTGTTAARDNSPVDSPAVRVTYATFIAELQDAAATPPRGPLSHRLDEVLTWWQTADERKQEGFYVDYHDQRWRSPGDVPQSAYERSAAVAATILPLVERLVAWAKDLSATERAVVRQELADDRNSVFARPGEHRKR